MRPAFSSWYDFFAMGGYGFYVWLAVCFTLGSLMILVAHTAWQRRQLLKSVRQHQARERRIRAAKMKQAASQAAGE
ncbi:MAG: heme exporter protein CcmD [Mixta calida]|jgi:heme exporter protein D|uniref:Heme exporter protein D n=1 Tax=Mixta calida TaxID=665913 RepID=A0ABN5HBM8_9GAMM|nr:MULTISPECIES: heme exporter protein CcmD [Mixta]MDU3817717.1 heme exporter protein CcmD [Pantoea sp.]AUY26061.1 heme exporter protein CcmD [Mixta calida]KAF0859502.1 CcmD [Mixta calida B021323]MCR1565646.1 heme exporter protein CcmD [Mixta sp.]MDU2733180.1 heme exporter protein CcmD [Mixta calida]